LIAGSAVTRLLTLEQIAAASVAKDALPVDVLAVEVLDEAPALVELLLLLLLLLLLELPQPANTRTLTVASKSLPM